MMAGCPGGEDLGFTASWFRETAMARSADMSANSLKRITSVPNSKSYPREPRTPQKSPAVSGETWKEKQIP